MAKYGSFKYGAQKYTSSVDIRSGLFSLTQASVITSSGNKIGRGAISIINANGILTVIGKPTKRGAISIVNANGTLAVVGYPTKRGAISITIPNATLNFVGASRRSGSISIVNANATLNLVGKPTKAGSIAISTANAILDLAGYSLRRDSISLTTPNATLTIEGKPTKNGSISIVDGNLVLQVVGESRRSGSISIENPNATLSLIGYPAKQGELSVSVININSFDGQKLSQGEIAIISDVSIIIRGTSEDPSVVLFELSYTEYNVAISILEYPFEVEIIEAVVGLEVIENDINVEVIEFGKVRLEVDRLAYIGSTVVLKATFPVTAGDLSLMTDVKVVVTDDNRKVIAEIVGADIEKISDDMYQTKYLIPATNSGGDIGFAFSGVIGGDIVLLARKKIERVWQS